MKGISHTLSPNLVEHKIQSHQSISKNKCLLNEAEILAMKAEQIRIEDEMNEMRLIEERDKKIKQNIKIYKQKNKIEVSNENLKKSKMDKIKEYNMMLRDKVIKRPNDRVYLQNAETSSKLNRDYATFSFNEGVQEEAENIESEPMPIKKETSLNDISNSYNVVNIREDLDKLISEKLLNLAQNLNLQGNLNLNISSIDIGCNLTESLNRQVGNLKEFRKTGTVSNNFNYSNDSSHYLHTQRKVENKEETNQKKRLEKRRYMKALRNLMIEKFREKKIVIPNICSCGLLQKKLDTLLEDKNVSVYSLINVECANNCIYYNNTAEYQKALADIIFSVKNIKYDNFGSNTRHTK